MPDSIWASDAAVLFQQQVYLVADAVKHGTTHQDFDDGQSFKQRALCAVKNHDLCAGNSQQPLAINKSYRELENTNWRIVPDLLTAIWMYEKRPVTCCT